MHRKDNSNNEPLSLKPYLYICQRTHLAFISKIKMSKNDIQHMVIIPLKNKQIDLIFQQVFLKGLL